MTNLHERTLPDPRIEPATVRMPGGRASDRATGPGCTNLQAVTLQNKPFISITLGLSGLKKVLFPVSRPNPWNWDRLSFYCPFLKDQRKTKHFSENFMKIGWKITMLWAFSYFQMWYFYSCQIAAMLEVFFGTSSKNDAVTCTIKKTSPTYRPSSKVRLKSETLLF